jgi:hypothetical protein
MLTQSCGFTISIMRINHLNGNKSPLNMEQKGWKLWIRRLGVAGFLFFFIKGLFWLALIFGAFKACS